MDRTSDYRAIIKRLLLEKEALFRRFGQDGHEQSCVFDEERDQYLLVNTGWVRERRQHGATLYLRIRDGKIWIEEDWTEDGIAAELVANGVPKADVVLGFQPPSVRSRTEFAAA
ncbi:MAG TPA: XisI protein [Armatimonadota bacterium]|nr:XisI protein [Armatimonadota bacterium]